MKSMRTPRGTLRATIAGQTVFVPKSQLSLTKHHGTTAAGTKVDSPSIGKLGDDRIAFQGSDGNIVSLNADDFEIGAIGHLKDLGYTVKSPKSS